MDVRRKWDIDEKTISRAWCENHYEATKEKQIHWWVVGEREGDVGRCNRWVVVARTRRTRDIIICMGDQTVMPLRSAEVLKLR